MSINSLDLDGGWSSSIFFYISQYKYDSDQYLYTGIEYYLCRV